jgi:hypothetical protein
MANTLKFGNGQWATKVGSTLAYNDEGGNFKPLPFNFTRSTSGTRVNKDGLIEMVTNNKPRIDFLNDSNGALLLEPERTNLVTTSEDFVSNDWFNSKARVTLEDNSTIAPDGNLNATKLISTNENNSHYIRRGTSDYSDAVTRTFSVYLKYGNEQKEITVLYQNKNVIVQFNSNGILSHVSNTASFYKIEDYGNGWYKVIISDTVSGGNFLYSGIYTENNQDGTSFFYIWGAQLEVGSYATSYIPTQGATATRVAETCIQTPPSGIIGQTEGTMYFDGYFGDEVTEIYLFTQSSTGIGVSDSMYLQKSGASSVKFIGRDASTQWDIIGGSFSIGQKIKIAAAYKNNDVVLYINGLQIGTDSVASIPTISNIKIGGYPAQPSVSSYFLSKPIESTQLYNTRLSNAELQALTTI